MKTHLYNAIGRQRIWGAWAWEICMPILQFKRSGYG